MIPLIDENSGKLFLEALRVKSYEYQQVIKRSEDQDVR